MIALLGFCSCVGAADPVRIVVEANRALHPVSPYLTGACLEDVNHEVYGGIYSQMIFGESFQEPASAYPFAGFRTFGGGWSLQEGTLAAASGAGSKIIADESNLASGEAGVEMLFERDQGGNAGFIINVNHAGEGADAFTGYEISVAPAGYVVLGRHRQNFEPISRTPCAVPLNQWMALKVAVTNATLQVWLNGRSVIQYTDAEFPLAGGQMGLRDWQQDVRFRNLWLSANGGSQPPAFFLATNAIGGGVSSMWTSFSRGSASGQCAVETTNPFVGRQSQGLTFVRGTGEVGIENEGLNRQGMYFAGQQLYEGSLWVRSSEPTPFCVSLENQDGSEVLAKQMLSVTSNNWQRLDFQLTPTRSNPRGRFAITLKQPGSVTLGYAFLEPGPAARYRGLPVRRDVAEGLQQQGITVLRYGGSMINAAGYRWKNMVGPRELRPPYTGTWYPYSSDGWGIIDFLNFCEAAGMMPIPDLNVGETPQDISDFIDYVNGSTNTAWGARRAADGHPEPYGLRHLELGNEERVDDNYFRAFKPLAEAIWAKDANIIITVGDFGYNQLITDPNHVTGADSRITNLDGQRAILQLAKQQDREVWFDVHVWTEGPTASSYLPGMFSFDDALGQIANGARYKVVVFELNANNHSQKRALANALAINAAERDGRLPVMTSANCLQPDGQNDNGWDQGLLFLNPEQVWLQPPGYVTKMKSASYRPLSVPCKISGGKDKLDVSAKRSQDGHTLTLDVVNYGSSPVSADLQLDDFAPTKPTATMVQLAGPLEAANSSVAQQNEVPSESEWRPDFHDGTAAYAFPAYSFTSMKFEGTTIDR